MSVTKRRSTVHDLSSLRLHPDGTRVGSSSNNHRPRNAKYVVQDRRGNWIARDAGGSGQVKQRRSVRSNAGEQDEKTEEYEDNISAADKGKARAQEEEADNAVKDRRAVRRNLFTDDLDFLSPSSPLLATGSVTRPLTSELDVTDVAIPDPTSDLLKSIHYFASTYYSEMGQLRDSSREYRREKKRRKIERLQAEQADTKDQMYSEEPGELAQDHEDREAEEEEPEPDAQDSEGEAQDIRSNKKRNRRRYRQERPHTGTDMYKIFDGSALMAMGMLLQEHIASTVSTSVPDGWEEAMLRAEGNDGKHSGGRRSRKLRGNKTQTTEGIDDTDAELDVPSDENENVEEHSP